MKCCDEGLAIAREIGDQNGIGTRIAKRGRCFESLIQYEKASECFDEGLAIVPN